MSATTWTVDAVHSSAEFEVSHVTISTFRGRFRSMQGKLVLDEENPAASALEATIDVRSVDVENKGLYDKLMDEDFFHVQAHPQLHYRSTSVRQVDASHWSVEGELTIRGVTRPVALQVEALGEANNPFARRPVRAFRARGELNRGDYGMKWNVPLDTGAPYLGEKVSLFLHIELLKEA